MKKTKQLLFSMKSLEMYMIQEVQTLRETIANRLQALDNLQSNTSESDTSEINMTGHQRGLKLPTPVRRQEDVPKVVMLSPLVFPVTVSEKPLTKHPKGYVTYQWEPIQLKELKGLKEAVVAYGLHSPPPSRVASCSTCPN